jgi:hypothetical protein
MERIGSVWRTVAILFGIALILAIGAWWGLPRLFAGPLTKGQELTRELLEKGEPAPAVILEVRETGLTLNENPALELVLEVRPDGRPPYLARTTALVSRLSVAEYHPGAAVKAVFDPKDASRVAVVGR